jgi:hypothetical protein
MFNVQVSQDDPVAEAAVIKNIGQNLDKQILGQPEVHLSLQDYRRVPLGS